MTGQGPGLGTACLSVSDEKWSQPHHPASLTPLSWEWGLILEFLSPFLWRAPPLEMRRERREFFPDHAGKASHCIWYQGSARLSSLWTRQLVVGERPLAVKTQIHLLSTSPPCLAPLSPVGVAFRARGEVRYPSRGFSRRRQPETVPGGPRLPSPRRFPRARPEPDEAIRRTVKHQRASGYRP